MYKKKCDWCKEKDVFVYGTGKDGSLPVAYCSKKCEANAKYEKRFDIRYRK